LRRPVRSARLPHQLADNRNAGSSCVQNSAIGAEVQILS
jgi:hypothetical protein